MLMPVKRETRAVSTAMSQAELPPPITSTRRPRKGALALYAWEWTKSPAKAPGYSGIRGSQWWPLATSR